MNNKKHRKDKFWNFSWEFDLNNILYTNDWGWKIRRIIENIWRQSYSYVSKYELYH